MGSTLLRPPSPLQILTQPSEFTWLPACRAFVENLLKQLQGAGRRGCCRVDVRFGSHTIGTRPFPLSNPPNFPFCLNPPFHFESLHNCLSLHFKFSILPSTPRGRHAKSPPLLESTCSMLGGAQLKVLCLISRDFHGPE